MTRTLPEGHELRDSQCMVALTMVLHDNGECCIGRDRYRGAEYYIYETGLDRVREFVEMGFVVAVTVFFVSGDNVEDHYKPSILQKETVEKQLKKINVNYIYFDVANKKDKNGGWVSAPGFYYYRNNNKIGFVPCAKIVIDRWYPMELEVGIDTISHSSLYKE